MAGKKPGRRPGMTKEVVQSRRILDKYDELRELVTEDFMDAYDVIRGVMRDEKAGHATRRQCANDVITIYLKMHKDAIEVVETFEEGSGSAYEGKAKEQRTGQGSGVLKFSLRDNTKENSQ